MYNNKYIVCLVDDRVDSMALIIIDLIKTLWADSFSVALKLHMKGINTATSAEETGLNHAELHSPPTIYKNKT
jgi:hypothetical protein